MEREKAEFNMALESLRQLAGWFLAANSAAMELDAHTWFHSLLCIHRDLIPYMSKGEIKNINSIISELKPEIKECVKLSEKSISKVIPDETYEMLNSFHLELRMILKNSGMLMRMAEKAGEALM